MVSSGCLTESRPGRVWEGGVITLEVYIVGANVLSASALRFVGRNRRRAMIDKSQPCSFYI